LDVIERFIVNNFDMDANKVQK